MLSDYELHEDCLCYLSYEGEAVKASRIFAGYEHEQQVKRLADHFKSRLIIILKSLFDTELLKKQKHSIKNLQLMNESSEPAFCFWEKENWTIIKITKKLITS